jgi:hypothetical protein
MADISDPSVSAPNTTEISKLVTFIEENLRSSPTAGLRFVDTRQLRSRLILKQNHIVFGRRGAGKTSLIRSVSGTKVIFDLYLNLEDYKDITFPNILIHVLIELFSLLRLRIQSNVPLWWCRPSALKVRQEIRHLERILQQYVHEPDAETQDITTTEASRGEIKAALESKVGGAGGIARRERSQQVLRKLPKSKIEFLRLELTNYKDLIGRISTLFRHAPIFLLLDDFYFVQKSVQPELIDYLHRLTKGTDLFIKLATIKHRSKLYHRSNDQYVGVELGHDIFEIDLDYTLDQFDDLQTFMREILQKAIDQSKVNIQIEEMFAGDGFPQLCLASGGVPRDFLSLFVALANGVVSSSTPIGKVQVSEAAIGTVNNKMESMKRDSGDEDAALDGCLKRIKRYVYDEKRTNAFLIAKDDLAADEQARQAVRELVDLRLIHLVDHNTSKAPSDGRRYEAYVIDISLYSSPRPRSFTQVEPGQRDEKARKDDLRASPVFALSKLKEPLPAVPAQAEPLPDIPGQLELILSEE